MAPCVRMSIDGRGHVPRPFFFLREQDLFTHVLAID